jgi:hypothetical protein
VGRQLAEVTGFELFDATSNQVAAINALGNRATSVFDKASRLIGKTKGAG